MMVHRLVAKYLLSGKAQSTMGDLEEACRHCSDREKLAVAAERASVKYKQAEWMEQHIGEVFDGIISGVTEYGVYVQLNETHCEGLLHMRELGTEAYWSYNEDDYCLVNDHTGEKLTLGERIRVEMLRADALQRRIDFRRAKQNE